MMNEPRISPENLRNQVRLRSLVSVFLWAGLFTLAYGQSPLYTSNQNQYFLHGLADAGFGFLDQDWLANTLDPTPVFSFLIYLTGRYLFWLPITYLYFGILAGIYIFSLFGMVSENFHAQFTKPGRSIYLSGLILLNSAALRYLVVRITAPDWAHLFDGGAAGQRLLGSVLQPSAFGVFLILSIYLFLRGKQALSVLFLVLAPTLHPTYLLSAAVLTLVFMGLAFQENKKVASPLMIAGLAIIGVAPVLIHAYFTFKGTDPVSIVRARELLVNFRIPHHAIPSVWLDGSVGIKIGFVLIAFLLTRKTRLFHILFWPFMISVLGSLVQVITHSNLVALLFPWRISTWLVPISMAVITFKILEKVLPWISKRMPGSFLVTTSLVLAVGLAAGGLTKSMWEAKEKKQGDDRPMMAYIAANKLSGSVYLIPLDMQDFRLETGAPVYIEFKSIPYKDIEVLEWYRRVAAAGNLYRAPMKRTGCKILSQLYQEGVTNVVLPYDHTVMTCSNLVMQFGDESYQVYQLIGAP
jgi:hypothetical protein